MPRLIVVLHKKLADWSCERRKAVGDLPDKAASVSRHVLGIRRQSEADELAPTPYDRMDDVATGLGDSDIRRPSIIVRARGREEPLRFDTAH
jgi:hypothetical protein